MTHGRVLVQRRFSRQVIYAINEEVVAMLFAFLTAGTALQPQVATLTVRQDGDVVGDGQGEPGAFGVGDDLASAANL